MWADSSLSAYTFCTHGSTAFMTSYSSLEALWQHSDLQQARELLRPFIAEICHSTLSTFHAPFSN